MLPARYTHDIPQPVQLDVHRADGLFARKVTIPEAGTFVPQHSHVYPHLTLLAFGSMRVWAGDELLGEFTAPQALTIAAGVKHTMMALTSPAVFFCCHNTMRTGDVEELEKHEFPPSDD